MDPGVPCHGMKANPTGYLWSNYDCFLKSECLDANSSFALGAVKLKGNHMIFFLFSPNNLLIIMLIKFQASIYYTFLDITLRKFQCQNIQRAIAKKNEKRDNKQCLLDTPRRVTATNERHLSKCKKSEKKYAYLQKPWHY